MHYNYHTHSALCGHGSGDMREYVETAIAGGIKKMGFSEHIPFVFPDGSESGHRVKFADAEEYASTVEQLKREYAGKIELHLGFEMEYYPLYFKEMLQNAVNWGAEYLILGQHYLNNEHVPGEPEGIWSGFPNDSIDDLEEYADCVIEAVKTRVFTYVAHPDLFNYTGDEESYTAQMRRICRASAEYNVPLEINFLGIRSDRHYPRELFWKTAGEERAPVVFGLDAHSSEAAACDAAALAKVKELAEKYNLNLVGEPKLIFIQK